MSQSHVTTASAVILALSLSAKLLAGTATIVPLQVAAARTESAAQSVSGGGSVVVGWVDDPSALAARWNAAGEATLLGALSDGGWSYARDASGDGSVIVGMSEGSHPGQQRGFIWTAGAGMQPLGPEVTEATGVNWNGTVIVGRSASDAFRWTPTTGAQVLLSNADARGVSADGTVVVGSFGPASRAYRWTAGTGAIDLGTLPGHVGSLGEAVSADGSTVVGMSFGFTDGTFSVDRAVRWSDATGIMDLGVLSGDFNSRALSTVADGSVVVGHSSTVAGVRRAFIWTEATGMAALSDYLSGLGVDLTGWMLEVAEDISHDGSSITGIGTFNGDRRGFFVTGLPAIPSPGSASSIVLLAWVSHRSRRRSAVPVDNARTLPITGR